mmetsp:Transcript_18337/g.40092  ORF Transcript_18337/g.40092 Transcript_18337/m.40092 type:complete len:201 (-) Transcript_18337:945-1547(-)
MFTFPREPPRAPRRGASALSTSALTMQTARLRLQRVRSSGVAPAPANAHAIRTRRTTSPRRRSTRSTPPCPTSRCGPTSTSCWRPPASWRSLPLGGPFSPGSPGWRLTRSPWTWRARRAAPTARATSATPKPPPSSPRPARTPFPAPLTPPPSTPRAPTSPRCSRRCSTFPGDRRSPPQAQRPPTPPPPRRSRPRPPSPR